MARTTLGVVVSLCLSVAAVAQARQAPVTPVTSVPRVVRVDGQFVPANGLAPAAVETVTLALYASASDATPLWEETQEVRVDAQGRYAVFLGATSADGVPVSVFATGDQRWLGLHFDRPGEGEQPRVLLTSVPYALRAGDADTLGGLPPAAFLRAAGRPTDRAANAAKGAQAGPGDAPSVSTGTPSFIGKFTSAEDLTSSVMFENSGRIGVNTTTPLDFFHSRFTDTSGTFTGYAVQNLGGGATAYSGMLFYDQNGALGQFQGFNNTTHEYRINNIAANGSINFMLSSQSKFLVRPDGDVNIPGNLYKGQFMILKAANSGSGHSIGLGEQALNVNVGIGNIGIGSLAIGGPSAGGVRNLGIGYSTLYANAGTGNVALGYGALSASSGSYNVALGDSAATSRASGNYNIYIGADVAGGGIAESNTIRIGDTANFTRFFAGGIRGVSTGIANAVPVVIDSQGQLGTVSSSRRFKTDIQDMAEASSGLMRLRPVTYRYKQAYADGSMPIDYGLIAEEVAEVYPDIVSHASDGQVETVQYQKVNAMLLNEVQKQYRENQAQQREIDDLRARLAALERLLASAPK